MGVLSSLEPAEVFYYFEEISKIPRGSGNVGQISDYLKRFAEERGLRVIQDALLNVIIFKDATAGYEQEPVLILQGHMDMVAVQEPDCQKDMRTQGLDLGVDGDCIYAEGTSLGGDDGIALAYALAILDSDKIAHPALEVIFTVDEETGMDGAREIDLSMLRGNRLLNLDSEEEGIFLASCAGGARVCCTLQAASDMVAAQENRTVCRIEIKGLLGGHSGEEIDKGRGNANVLLGQVLYRLCEQFPIQLVSAEGGLADNAIPRRAVAEILPGEDAEGVAALLQSCAAEICGELQSVDPAVAMDVTFAEETAVPVVFSVADTRRAAAMLAALPNGVQRMSADICGLVETSLNLGILRLARGSESLAAEFSVRSSVESAKEALIRRLFAVTELAGGTNTVTGAYPGWKYRTDSPLREKMIRVYRELYGTEPRVEAIHAGVECGLLGSKLVDPDCVSIGPNMRDIHTTEETLSISSVGNVWRYLVKLLETKE
ncbi:MAG: aminoacyl-histidine dipeptidase [Lachnospiraceae bacterium]|nr:aminoacyl-histidine dipeptidase [Lachnospiraceae bacterium]